jgi:hypothetical protein
MFIRALLLSSCFFSANVSYGCIWQSEIKSGSSPFWPSNNIPVCFQPPRPETMTGVDNPLDAEYLSKFTEFMNLIRRTVESQINGRSNFKLSGFGYCEPNSQSSDLTPKIRIDLNGTEGTGAMALSIGPKSSRDSVNLSMSLLYQDWPGGVKPNFNSGTPLPKRVRVFNSPRDMSWASLHEIMHLLGFHHTEYWNQDMTSADENLNKVIQIGSEQDSHSIMTRGIRNFNAEGMAVLSDRDVSCLNQVADRSILSLPDRTAAIGAQIRASPSNSKSLPTAQPRRRSQQAQ